jgi:hypothetical protein
MAGLLRASLTRYEEGLHARNAGKVLKSRTAAAFLHTAAACVAHTTEGMAAARSAAGVCPGAAAKRKGGPGAEAEGGGGGGEGEGEGFAAMSAADYATAVELVAGYLREGSEAVAAEGGSALSTQPPV